MRYIYTGEKMSVPPPKEIAPPPPPSDVDTLQDLIARRKEQESNRLKYHLTEKDCNLICTNATELHFSNGQVIANEGAQITSVYRIKCGRVSLMKAGSKLYDLSTGYFIGEGLFIRGEAKDIFGAALVANGPVILCEVNLPFVRQMLDADKVLAFKIYRHMACKLSALLFSVVTKVSTELPTLAPILTRSDSMSSTNSDSSTSSGSSLESPVSSVSSSSIDSSPGTPSMTGSDRDMDYPPKAAIMSSEMVSARARKTKKHKHCPITGPKPVAFKAYALEGDHVGSQALLDTKKITITSGSRVRSNRKIKYNKILDMSKTGKNSVTIIYNVQAKTIFFKQEEELNEFFGLVQSLIISNAKQQALESPNPSPSASPSLVPVNPQYPLAPHPQEEVQHAADKMAFHKLAVRQDLVKGDIVVAEGDLYQRVYTIVSGEFHMKRGNRTLVTMQEGEVFGVLTLFHLRPSMLTIEVASDTATLLVIPVYKIQELIASNFQLAVRFHKKSAQLVYGQIEKVLLSREGVVKGFSDSGVLL